MAKIKLSRVNNEEEEGEAFGLQVENDLVLGRGPLLQIDQTSITRRLASLVWRSEEQRMELVSLHKTPIRVYSHGSGDWSTLAKDTPLECLEVVEGDTVELTESFVFKVTSITSEMEGETDRNLPDEESIALGNNLENEDPKGERIKPLPTGVMGVKKKKRELPNWMMANSVGLKKSKIATSLPSALNEKYLENVKFINSGPTFDLAAKEDKEEPKKNGKVKTTSHSPIEISDEEEEDGAKLVSERLRIDKGEPMKQTAKENSKTTGVRKSPYEYHDEEVKAPVGSGCLKFPEYAEYIKLLGNPPAEGKGPSAQSSSKVDECLGQGSVEKEKDTSQEEDNFTFPVLITPEDVQDDDAKEDVGTRKMNSDVSQATARRPSCAFGASCYRKNPAHRNDTAHPGDHDFKDITDQDSGDDERPECEYGVECYRKNPQHRKDFKHSLRPQPTRKAKEATKKKTSKDVDEYESDFIDDEEDGWEPVDDSDNDADWAPQQEDDDDDTQELEVNAKKRKKVYDDESEVESIVADNIDDYSSS